MLPVQASVQTSMEQIYREEWGRIVAILIRTTGSFPLAEEAAQDAFAAALAQWPLEGIPANPRAWLIATARHKALDVLRRQTRWVQDETALAMFADPALNGDTQDESVEDDRLRLIFTCCHPALAIEAQVALTLRTLCGLTTEQIANAFLVPVSTMAQRLVRAQAKIHDAGIPYRAPQPEDLAERLSAVLLVVYLVFNEGYNNPGAGNVLCDEAIYLARLLSELVPGEPEVRGLLALMLLQHARREARHSGQDGLTLLQEQDRALWKADEIEEGIALAKSALRTRPGPYAVQAAIAALHGEATTSDRTDWPQIVALYDVLLRMQPSPVVELNRAVAIAMAQGSDVGLVILDRMAEEGELERYAPFHAARAALLCREQSWTASTQAYRKALACTGNEYERNFLAARLAEMELKSTQS